jgi:hypothetical protein
MRRVQALTRLADKGKILFMANFPSINAKINDLIPYARNSRTHSDEQVIQIAASIKEFGFTNPVLIDTDNGIIAGHGRVMAAKKLGLKEVPCIVADGWTDAQKKAYIIADNKLALNAGWDNALLALEFAELEELGFDLSLTGFGPAELNDILCAVNVVDLPELKTEDPEYRQFTFTIHNEQAGFIEDAISCAKKDPLVDTGINKNSNGNALTLICEQWLKQKT